MSTHPSPGDAAARLRTPRAWQRPDVLLASLGINLLALALPLVVLQVYDRIVPSQAVGTFTVLLVSMAGVIVMDAALRVFRSLIMSWDGARFEHVEAQNVLNRLLHADTLAFEGKPSGSYLDRMQGLEQIQEFYSGQSILLLMDFPFAIVFLFLIWVIAGPMVWVPAALLVAFILVAIVTGRRLHEALQARSTIEERRQNFVIEVLRGIHTVKSMAMESMMLRRYERLQGQSALSVYELSRVNSVVQGVGATFSQVAVATFVGIGCFLVVEGTLSIGALAAGTMLCGRVLQPGLRAMGVWTQFQSLRLARRKVAEVLALPIEESGEAKTDGQIEGRIALDQVRFRYPDQSDDLIAGISIEIAPGETIGITGNNGVGKSTLIALMSGFLRPDAGRITLDGRPLTAFNQEDLRAQIGLMPQHGVLFEGTILENMTLYREGEAITHAVELSRALGLDEVITRLPEGLDTQVGGAAVDALSEGTRQKIVMVRSLVGHPKIVLFDDANANFDIKNDVKLVSLMHRLKGERTMVFVSHRPSFLKLCDRQFELRAGTLRELPRPKLSVVPDPLPSVAV